MNGLIGDLALQPVDWPGGKGLVIALDMTAKENTLKPKAARTFLNVKQQHIFHPR